MAPPINPQSYMQRIIAACQEPCAAEQLAELIGTDVETVRRAVGNLVSRKRLVNLRTWRRGIPGLYVVNDGRHVVPEVVKPAPKPRRVPWDHRALVSAWRQPA
jgi:hypothetical protein